MNNRVVVSDRKLNTYNSNYDANARNHCCCSADGFTSLLTQEDRTKFVAGSIATIMVAYLQHFETNVQLETTICLSHYVCQKEYQYMRNAFPVTSYEKQWFVQKQSNICRQGLSFVIWYLSHISSVYEPSRIIMKERDPLKYSYREIDIICSCAWYRGCIQRT